MLESYYMFLVEVALMVLLNSAPTNTDLKSLSSFPKINYSAATMSQRLQEQYKIMPLATSTITDNKQPQRYDYNIQLSY